MRLHGIRNRGPVPDNRPSAPEASARVLGCVFNHMGHQARVAGHYDMRRARHLDYVRVRTSVLEPVQIRGMGIDLSAQATTPQEGTVRQTAAVVEAENEEAPKGHWSAATNWVSFSGR
ncbi:hypothetical protein Sliba_79100 [Streptomyces nigrescens]|uniref:Uncharacterized protein n=1 Tax=Streptomyces nigrescens TaxID=1920 RepID=A0A640TUX8_STRNI|nr:hypothetical protein Sliba_79100 [Streptomyces libani subsp. libani]GGV96083.1 hypothetical protein GCM10010500_37970 [Streptomyces libani subsp. libani]